MVFHLQQYVYKCELIDSSCMVSIRVTRQHYNCKNYKKRQPTPDVRKLAIEWLFHEEIVKNRVGHVLLIASLLINRLFPSPFVVSFSVVACRTVYLIRKADIKGKTLLINRYNLNSCLLKSGSPGFNLYGVFRGFRSLYLNFGTGIDYFADLPWKEYTDESVAWNGQLRSRRRLRKYLAGWKRKQQENNEGEIGLHL